jgi:membrane glycosyltransferase
MSKPTSTSWRHQLTRQRHHWLIDLLLGLFVLISVLGWIGSVSPLLAAVVFAVAAWFYLASLPRRGQHRASQNAALATPPADGGRSALDALDQLLAAAPPVPLTNLVRVDPRVVTPLVDAVRAAAVERGVTDQAEKLSRALLGGRPIPLTGQLRVDRQEAQRLLQSLR